MVKQVFPLHNETNIYIYIEMIKRETNGGPCMFPGPLKGFFFWGGTTTVRDRYTYELQTGLVLRQFLQSSSGGAGGGGRGVVTLQRPDATNSVLTTQLCLNHDGAAQYR